MAVAGKASITLDGVWESSKEYDRLCGVKHNNSLFISRKKPPIGVEPVDGDYWMLVIDGISNDEWDGLINDVTNLDNKIDNLTAEEVGARPDDWMPSAEDVGARPETWMPTASDVGAVPQTDGTLNMTDIGSVSFRRNNGTISMTKYDSSGSGVLGYLGFSGVNIPAFYPVDKSRAYRLFGQHNLTTGTSALTANSSELETYSIYLQYE